MPERRFAAAKPKRVKLSSDQANEKREEKAVKIRRSLQSKAEIDKEAAEQQAPVKRSMFKALSKSVAVMGQRVNRSVEAFSFSAGFDENKFNTLVATKTDQDKEVDRIVAWTNRDIQASRLHPCSRIVA